MGNCDTILNDKKTGNKNKKNKGKQPFSAPITKNSKNINNTTNLTATMNTMSQLDLKSYCDMNKNKPALLYKYKGTYRKKGEQISVMTATLNDLQGNSLINNKTKNSRNNMAADSIYSFIEGNENQSSDDYGFEIISNGKMDEDMVQKSTDKSTIDSYNEFIGKKQKNETHKNKIDIYNKKPSKNNKRKEDMWNCPY